MKHILYAFFILFALPALAESKVQKISIKNPIIADAEILFYSGLNSIWMQIYNPEDYEVLIKESQAKNKKHKALMVMISLYGVKDIPVLKDTLKEDKQQNAILELDRRTRNRSIELKCYGYDKGNGSPVCEVMIGSINLGHGLIENGYSPFISNLIKDEDMIKKYTMAHEKAKKEGIGIWQPYYGLFDNIEKKERAEIIFE